MPNCMFLPVDIALLPVERSSRTPHARFVLRLPENHKKKAPVLQAIPTWLANHTLCS